MKIDKLVNTRILDKGPVALIQFLTLSILSNFILVVLVFLSYANPILPNYFSTSQAGASTPISAITEPNTSDTAVLQWANIAAISALSYDFVNYQTQLNNASQYFTSDGWSTYMLALKSSNNLEEVVAKKLIVNVVATKPPIILQKGVLNGSYSWSIEIPVLLTYKSASGLIPQNLVIRMLVSRVPTLESYKGLGIKQFLTITTDITNTTSIQLSQ